MVYLKTCKTITTVLEYLHHPLKKPIHNSSHFYIPPLFSLWGDKNNKLWLWGLIWFNISWSEVPPGLNIISLYIFLSQNMEAYNIASVIFAFYSKS